MHVKTNLFGMDAMFIVSSYGGVSAPCTTFIMTFPDSVPKFTITKCSLGLGNVMTVVLGSDRQRGFHQQGVQGNFRRHVNGGIDGDGGGDLRLVIPKEMESMGIND